MSSRHEIILDIESMSCADCVRRVEKALKNVLGMEEVSRQFCDKPRLCCLRSQIAD